MHILNTWKFDNGYDLDYSRFCICTCRPYWSSCSLHSRPTFHLFIFDNVGINCHSCNISGKHSPLSVHVKWVEPGMESGDG